MGRVRQIVVASALAAALGSGCVHVHTDAEGNVKSVSVGQPTPAAQPGDPATGGGAQPPGAVKQAGAVGKPDAPPAKPAGGLMSALSPLPRTSAKPATPSKTAAAHITVMWQTRLASLPDQARGGAMGQGLVGQLFMYDQNFQFAMPDGPLTVDLYDETPRANVAPGQGPLLERWQINKDVLQTLVTMDEKFGKSYALFLPWPSYRPDINRVRMMVKYEQEGGHTLYATASTITIDNRATAGGSPAWAGASPPVNPAVPGGGSVGGTGLPPAGTFTHNGGLQPTNGFPPPGGAGFMMPPIPMGGAPAPPGSGGMPGGITVPQPVQPAGGVPAAPYHPGMALPPVNPAAMAPVGGQPMPVPPGGQPGFVPNGNQPNLPAGLTPIVITRNPNPGQ